jgi:transposase
MPEDEHITVTCQNCGEEITNSRAYFKQRDWECPHCGGSIIPADEQKQPDL